MGSARRVLTTAILLGFAMACTVITVAASDRPVAAHKPAPKIYLVSPARVNLQNQPNVVLTGQNLAATTQVVVGGRAATTLEAPDANHLLVKLPSDLADGTYMLEASNGDATSMADAMLTVQASGMLDRNSMLIVFGGVALLLLAARLARFQTF
jgi:methionine-rich copper-binding protein CopC